VFNFAYVAQQVRLEDSLLQYLKLWLPVSSALCGQCSLH